MCCVQWSGEVLSRSSPSPPPHTLPPLPPRGGTREGEIASISSTRHPPFHPPSPTPTWAEVARGEQGIGGARSQPPQPAASNSTPASPSTNTGSNPLPPPSAYSQYMAWVRCRREGIPARLVLETDGTTEDVCLWFRPTAIGGNSAANVPTHAWHSGKRRRERARRVRRQEERRREAEERCQPPAVPTPGVAAMTATVPSFSPRDAPPPTETLFPQSTKTLPARAHMLRVRPLPTKQAKAVLTASRASKRAAVLAKKRGTVRRSTSSSREADEYDAPALDNLREAEEKSSFNLTIECSLQLLPSTPPSASTPVSATPTPLMREDHGGVVLETTFCCSSPPPPPPSCSTPTPPSSTTLASATTPPPPLPMSSRFPRYFRKVVCQECFYWAHDYRYYHCMFCHTNGPPKEEVKLNNIKIYAVSTWK